MEQRTSNSGMEASPSIALLRPLVADIPGDNTERLYFHQFRRIAKEVMGIRHDYNGLFWGYVIPQYSHEVEAVKHGCIALSSAHHHFRIMGARPDVSAPPGEVERFVIKHYNLSMTKMNEIVQRVGIQKRYGITMICCIIFFYIEILRGGWPTALTHLANGLRLMSNLPDEVAQFLKHPWKWGKGKESSHSRALYMIRLLCRWEMSAGFLATGMRPSMSIQSYESRKLDCVVPADVISIKQLQDGVDDFLQDVNAFAWQSRQKSDDKSWDCSDTRLQYGVLQQRAHNISALFENCREGKHSKEAGGDKIPEYLAFQASLLHHRGASLVLDHMGQCWNTHHSLQAIEISRFGEIVSIASSIRTSLLRSMRPGIMPWFNFDLGVVPTLYIVTNCCNDVVQKAKLLQMMMDWPWKENLWDGPALRQLLQERPGRLLHGPTTPPPIHESNDS